MHRVVKQLVSALGATAMLVSSAMPAFASWSSPDYSDVDHAVKYCSGELLEVTALVNLIAGKTKVVYIEDVLSPDQVTVIKNSLNSLDVLAVQNVLVTKNVLNGLTLISFGDFLSNNHANLKDVIAVNVLNDGNVLVFCCH
jgi:hypothetical protein